MEKLEENTKVFEQYIVVKTSHKAQLLTRYINGKSCAGSGKNLLQRSKSKRRALCTENNDFNTFWTAEKFEKSYKIDIVNDNRFKNANDIFLPCLRKMKTDGAG